MPLIELPGWMRLISTFFSGEFSISAWISFPLRESHFFMKVRAHSGRAARRSASIGSKNGWTFSVRKRALSGADILKFEFF